VGSPVLHPPAAGESPELGNVAIYSARESGGRLVVSTQGATGVEVSSVLLPDGHEIAREVGGDVVCARAGCVRLTGRGRGAPGGTGDDALLGVEALGRGVSFQLPLRALTATPLAAHGDHVLVRLRVATPEAGEDDGAPDLAVLDLARREAVPVVLSDGHSSVTTAWRQPGLGALALAARTRDGFLLATADAAGRASWLQIDCRR
jgi:hypothetical protein